MTPFEDVAGAVLASGVKVSVCRVDSPVASVAVCVRAGSRHEPVGAAGATHMLEHLLLRRRERAGELSLVTEVDRLGGEANALTAKEELIAFCRVPARNALAALDLLATCITEQPVPADVFDAERRVVLDELSGRASNPRDVALDLLFENAFPDDGLGRPVPGTHESVGALDSDALEALRKERIHAGTVAVVVVGPDDAGSVVARLERTPLAGLRNGRWNPRPTHAQFAARREGEPYLRAVRSDYGSVVLAAAGVPYGDPDEPAAELVAQLLGGSASSLLYEHLRDRLGLAYGIWAVHRPYTDAGVLRIEVDADPAAVPEVIRASRRLVAERVERGWSESEVDLARTQSAGQLLLECESSADLAIAIARHRHVGGLGDWTVDRRLAALEETSADRVHDVARRLLGGGLAAFAAGGFDGAPVVG